MYMIYIYIICIYIILCIYIDKEIDLQMDISQIFCQINDRK